MLIYVGCYCALWQNMCGVNSEQLILFKNAQSYKPRHSPR